MPSPVIPLRINDTLRLFVFFYIGFGIRREYFNFLKPKNTIKPIIICIIIYFSAFILHYILMDENYEEITSALLQNNGEKDSLLFKLINATFGRTLKFVMSLSGLLGAFWSAHYFVIGKYKLPDWMIALSTYCYGIYICQQFILRYMYYNTPLPELFGNLMLPWVSILITLVLSILITWLLLKTKFGRFLLG